MRSGRPFPPWDRRPRLRDDVLWAWEAFADLSTCRPGGEGVRAIPWTALNEYARAHGIWDAHRFERLIRAMDSEFMASVDRAGAAMTKRTVGRKAGA